MLEELPADVLLLVLHAHEELINTRIRALDDESRIPCVGALDLGDEDGLALQDGKRVLVSAPLEARQPEENALVLRAIWTDDGPPVHQLSTSG